MLVFGVLGGHSRQPPHVVLQAAPIRLQHLTSFLLLGSRCFQHANLLYSTASSHERTSVHHVLVSFSSNCNTLIPKRLAPYVHHTCIDATVAAPVPTTTTAAAAGLNSRHAATQHAGIQHSPCHQPPIKHHACTAPVCPAATLAKV